jgi:hypothetical protein
MRIPPFFKKAPELKKKLVEQVNLVVREAGYLEKGVIYQTQRALHKVNDVANPLSKSSPLFDVPKDVYKAEPVQLFSTRGITKTILAQTQPPFKAGKDHVFGVNDTLGVNALRKIRSNVQTGVIAFSIGAFTAIMPSPKTLPNTLSPLDLAQQAITVISAGVSGKSLRKLVSHSKEFKSPDFYGTHLFDVRKTPIRINDKQSWEVTKTPIAFARIEKDPQLAADLYATILTTPEDELKAAKIKLLQQNKGNTQLFLEGRIAE